MGYIETIGLVAAIAAADAALKAASVSLVGREISKGNGMVTVKIAGEVSAVKAAIAAASSVGEMVGNIVSTDVIPRPAAGCNSLLSWNSETLGALEWLEERTESSVEAKEKDLPAGMDRDAVNVAGVEEAKSEQKEKVPPAKSRAGQRKGVGNRKNNLKKGG